MMPTIPLNMPQLSCKAWMQMKAICSLRVEAF